MVCLLWSATSNADTAWDSQTSLYLQQLLQTNPERLPELDEPDLVESYQQRAFKLLWSNEQGRLDRAYDLLQIIVNARDEGLDPGDYYLDGLRRLWDSGGVGEAVKLDLLLSAAL